MELCSRSELRRQSGTKRACVGRLAGGGFTAQILSCIDSLFIEFGIVMCSLSFLFSKIFFEKL